MPLQNKGSNTVDHKKTLQELLDLQLNPLQQNVMKTVQKVQKDQVLEAMQQGVPAENILEDMGINIDKLNPASVADKSAQQMVTTPLTVQKQKGLIGNLFGRSQVLTDPQGNPTGVRMGGMLDANASSTQEALQNLLMLSKVQGQPIEQQAEQRRLAQEERRVKESERMAIRQFGRTVTESQIPELLQKFGIDASAMIETYGIPATIDPKTGERSWNLLDMYTQSTMAKNKPVTDSEMTYLQDRFDAVDTTQEILDDMAKLGIKDPSEIGSFEIPEGFWSDMGPMSIPARFNIAGQYAKDPRYSALKKKIERMFQKYRKIITGAQASDKELKTLRPLIIGLTDRPGVFFAAANDLVHEGLRSADTRLQLMEGAGRNIEPAKKMIEARKNKKVQGGTQQGGLQVGMTKGGYRFKGGNPADKNNWEKL